jgi:hypothetical protein
MTARDELWALGLLLTLAALLYLMAWLVEGPPSRREDPMLAPVEAASEPDLVF